MHLTQLFLHQTFIPLTVFQIPFGLHGCLSIVHEVLLEVLRVEVLRIEVLRVEVLRVEGLRVEVLRVEVLRVEVLRVEVLRVDVLLVDVLLVDVLLIDVLLVDVLLVDVLLVEINYLLEEVYTISQFSLQATLHLTQFNLHQFFIPSLFFQTDFGFH